MSKLCTIPGCERPIRAKGYCGMHYQRVRITGKSGTIYSFYESPVFSCGHPKTPDNTGLSKSSEYPDGTPYCRICHAKKAARFRDSLPEDVRKARARKYANDTTKRLRAEAIEAYGGACVCCGETTPEFLHLDHTNNDGAEHRRELKQGGRGSNSLIVLRWAKDNNWPDRLQLKCHNCGMAEGFYGYCPHEVN